jgi:hypothetical protein
LRSSIHPSRWRPSCSTTTPTATTRSPAHSSRGSHRRIYFDVVASQGFVQALRDALWFEIAIYLLSALAMLLLPKQAIATYGEPSLEQATVES